MKKVELILAILLLLVTLNSTYYFLGIAKVKVIEWLVFNACAVANLVFLAGFAVYLMGGGRALLHAALLPLFFFGVLGLYLFPWSGYNLIAQASHIIMALNLAVTVYQTLRTGDYQAATFGLLLGILICGPFINFQQTYAFSHAQDLQRILGVSADNFSGKLGAK